MIDFHSHILYGVDDGSKDENMTIEMLKIAESSGTSHIVATPHFYSGRFQVPFEEIHNRVEAMKALARENNIKVDILCGQEVYYTDRILEMYESGEISTIENTRYMLIELSMGHFSRHEVIDNVYELQLKGIVPILAHPERYERFIKSPELINRFIDEGFLFQLNTGSVNGDFGRNVKKTAEIFVKNKIYSVIGSDAHRVESRNTDMRDGIRAMNKISRGYSEEIEDIYKRILRNEKVEFPGKQIKKGKGILGIFKK